MCVCAPVPSHLMNGCDLFEKPSFLGLLLEYVGGSQVQSIRPEMFEGTVVPITTFNSFNRNHH